MTTTFLRTCENGFLQKNAKAVFSKNFGKSTLRISLTFTKKEENWSLEGQTMLSNHAHHMHNIPLSKGDIIILGLHSIKKACLNGWHYITLLP